MSDLEWTEEHPGPYRDGRIHVLSRMCSTCVFRPGNLMDLNSGRLKGMVEESLAQDSAITCHQTLPYGGYAVPGGAVCRGFYDAHGHRVTPLQIAERIGLVSLSVPADQVLYLFRIKDEGILFYFGRTARQLAGPDQVPALEVVVELGSEPAEFVPPPSPGQGQNRRYPQKHQSCINCRRRRLRRDRHTRPVFPPDSWPRRSCRWPPVRARPGTGRHT